MDETRRVAVMWSGGKDAMLTLEALQEQGVSVEALLTTVTADAEVVTAHGTPLDLIEKQAASLDIPVHVMRVPPSPSNEVYEEQLEAALEPLLAWGVEQVAVGDLHLEDVRAYREEVLRRIGATPIFPIWGEDTARLARRFIGQGYQAIVTSVDTTQLDAGFAGRHYDTSFLKDLPDGTDPCGENGEFHTFVFDGPPFAEAVPVRVEETQAGERMQYAQLES